MSDTPGFPPKSIVLQLRLEGLFALAAAATAYWFIGGNWWLFAVLLLARLLAPGRPSERFGRARGALAALAELRRVIYLSPYEAQAHLLMGRIHLRAGRPGEADPAPRRHPLPAREQRAA